MRTLMLCLLALVAFALPASAAGITLPYGTGDGQVAFFNAKNHPESEELHPWGPQSFRCAPDGSFWVADSVANRILHLSADGKVQATLPVASAPGGLIADLALAAGPDGQVTSLFVLSGQGNLVVELGPDGTQKRAFGGEGDAAGTFLQPELIEVNAAGQIFVADRARQSLTIFTPTGQVLRDLHWEWSGFCLDPAGNLCRLRWDEPASVTHLIIETPDGKPIRDTVLDIGDHTDPRLWRVTAAGEALVSWIPGTGFAGFFPIATFDTAGQKTVTAKIVPPVAMNRFLDQATDGSLVHSVANYDDAPDGAFRLEPFSLK
ncbi:MAG: hypothetical protein GX442_12815 [Candidatus Riflebacteria bacterium]|nr:hypothetical protein [Candidatus Riflebacteria bacterium]